jgi:transcriptional regulator with XRE-family HTH domain
MLSSICLIALPVKATFAHVTPLVLRIRELRERQGWSQAELARRAGVAQSMVSRLERGRLESVHLPTLEKLARALGCDPGYLIARKGK